MLDDSTFSQIALSYSLLSPAALREVEEFAAMRKQSRVEVALQTGTVKEAQLVQAVARSMGLEWRDLDSEPPPLVWARRMPLRAIRALKAVPLGQDPRDPAGGLRVGMVDPLDVEAQEEVSTLLQAAIVPVVVGRTAFDNAVARLARTLADSPGAPAPSAQRTSASQTRPSGEPGARDRGNAARTQPGSTPGIVPPRETMEVEQLPGPGQPGRNRTTRNVALPAGRVDPPGDPLTVLLQRYDSDALLHGLIEALAARRILSLADLERAIEERKKR